MSDALNHILEQVRDGELSPDRAAAILREQAAQPLGYATIDHLRGKRCGAAEVIYAQGKTADQVVEIAEVILEREGAVLITRCDAAQLDMLTARFNVGELRIGERRGTVLIGTPPEARQPGVAIVTAGTSDQPIAEEAELTCIAHGRAVVRISDVGVAGLHRLGANLDKLRDVAAIICIAGMEGALPSVVGGLVDVPVIAVPTSVGYGAAFDGLAALLGMLTSCASGVTVVNIDNGFGAAHAACLIAARIGVSHESESGA
jgi:NCAIR mutase (PurE)-related protein